MSHVTKQIKRKPRCKDEFFEYETRTYYYCDLIKGHRGDHKHTSVVGWGRDYNG